MRAVLRTTILAQSSYRVQSARFYLSRIWPQTVCSAFLRTETLLVTLIANGREGTPRLHSTRQTPTPPAMDCDELSMALPRYPPQADGPKAGPSLKPDYANPDFWDARFQDTEGLFDWYATYDELNDTFEEFCPIKSHCEDSLLVVGCGNSAFSAELHGAGYQHITSIDISSSAISKMKQLFDRPGMTWHPVSKRSRDFFSQLFDFPDSAGQGYK